MIEYKTDPWSSSRHDDSPRGNQRLEIGDFVVIQNMTGLSRILNGRVGEIVGFARATFSPQFYFRIRLVKPIWWALNWRHTHIEQYAHPPRVRIASPLEVLAGSI